MGMRDAPPDDDDDVLGVEDDEPQEKVGCRFVMQLMAASMLSGLCAVNWLGLAAIFSEAKSFYGVGPSALNAVSTLYLGIYCVTCFPCAFVADKWGVKMALILGGLTQALGAGITAWTKRFDVLVIGSIIAAAGQPFLVSTPAAFSQTFAPVHLRTRSTTVVSVCNNLGSAVVFAGAPRAVKLAGVRGWLLLRFGAALFVLLVTLLAFGGGTTTKRHRKTVSSGFGYAKAVTRMLVSCREMRYVVAVYGIGQGAFWAWAELPDVAFGAHFSDASIGSVGAVMTCVSCFVALFVGRLVDGESLRIDVVLAVAQTSAAVAYFIMFAVLKWTPASSWTMVAPTWLLFSLTSTPTLPLGAELAARFAPSPDLVAASVGAAFFVAEISSAVLGFVLGSSNLVGANLVLVVFFIAAIAALPAIRLATIPRIDDSIDDDDESKHCDATSDTLDVPLLPGDKGLPR